METMTRKNFLQVIFIITYLVHSTQQTRKCTKVFNNELIIDAWDSELSSYCGVSFDKEKGEKHSQIIIIRKRANPTSDGKSKMNIQSKDRYSVQLWVLGVLPFFIDNTHKIYNAVIKSTNERVTIATAGNKQVMK